MTINYKGKLVCCCCANCINARAQIGEKIKCSESGEMNHEMYECEWYKFSWQRFEDQPA